MHEPDSSELQDQILELLEEANIPAEICDKIMRLVDEGEQAAAAAAEDANDEPLDEDEEA